MVGPHPEADENWFAMYNLKNPDGKMNFDLVDTLMK
jgi:hypothetical protein